VSAALKGNLPSKYQQKTVKNGKKGIDNHAICVRHILHTNWFCWISSISSIKNEQKQLKYNLSKHQLLCKP